MTAANGNRQSAIGPFRIPHFALLAVGILLLLGLMAMPPEAMTHHDTGAKYLQVRNLRITTSGLDYAINYPARPLDPTLQYVPFREKQHYIDSQERIYLQWPIFLGLLTRIPWKVLGFWGLYVVPFLAGLGACWTTYLLALAVGVPRRVAWLAIPVLGLATPVAIYSMLFFEHTLADMLVALSILFAVLAIPKSLGIESNTGDTPTPGRGVPLHPHIDDEENMGDTPTPSKGVPLHPRFATEKIGISGALLAVGIYFRSDLYVLAAVMGLVLLVMAWRVKAWRRLFVVWVVAFVLALVPLWAFYAISEGTLLPLHATWYFAGSEGATMPGEPVKFELPALRYIVRAGWGIIPDFLMGSQSFASSPIYPLWVGALGLIGTLLCGLAALLRLVRGKFGEVGVRLGIFAVGLACVAIATTYVLLMPQDYHNLHGFLLASPFIALALWPPAVIWAREGLTRQGLLYVVTLVHIGMHALIISALSGLGPISRHEWGQRYLLTAYPGLTVLALLAAWRIWTEYKVRSTKYEVASKRGTLRTLYFVLCTLYLVVVGGLFSLRGYAVLYDERTQVRAWLTLSESLPAREPLVTDDWWLPLNLAADFYTRPIMLAAGDDKLAKWAGDMQARGVTHFGFMTDKPEVFTGAWLSRVPGLSADGAPVEVRGIWLQRYRFGENRGY